MIKHNYLVNYFNGACGDIKRLLINKHVISNYIKYEKFDDYYNIKLINIEDYQNPLVTFNIIYLNNLPNRILVLKLNKNNNFGYELLINFIIALRDTIKCKSVIFFKKFINEVPIKEMKNIYNLLINKKFELNCTKNINNWIKNFTLYDDTTIHNKITELFNFYRNLIADKNIILNDNSFIKIIHTNYFNHNITTKEQIKEFLNVYNVYVSNKIIDTNEIINIFWINKVLTPYKILLCKENSCEELYADNVLGNISIFVNTFNNHDFVLGINKK